MNRNDNHNHQFSFSSGRLPSGGTSPSTSGFPISNYPLTNGTESRETDLEDQISTNHYQNSPTGLLHSSNEPGSTFAFANYDSFNQDEQGFHGNFVPSAGSTTLVPFSDFGPQETNSFSATNLPPSFSNISQNLGQNQFVQLSQRETPRTDQMPQMESPMPMPMSGSYQIQDQVRKQYEEILPPIIQETEDEIDLAAKQLADCNTYLKEQLELADIIQAEKLVPTLLHQLAVIYTTPLPTVEDDDIGGSAVMGETRHSADKSAPFHSKQAMDIRDKLVSSKDLLCSFQVKGKAVGKLTSYVGVEKEGTVMQITTENLQQITSELTNLRFGSKYEPSGQELKLQQETLMKEWAELGLMS